MVPRYYVRRSLLGDRIRRGLHSKQIRVSEGKKNLFRPRQFPGSSMNLQRPRRAAW